MAETLEEEMEQVISWDDQERDKEWEEALPREIYQIHNNF